MAPLPEGCFFKNAIDLAFADEASEKSLVEEYKQRLDKIFFPTARNGVFSLKDSKATLKEFSKLTKKPVLLGDLLLYFAECGTEFTVMYGDIDERFYAAVGDAYAEAVNFAIDDEALYKSWAVRIEKVYQESYDLAWGFGEYVSEMYWSLPWIEEEE